VLGDRRDRLAAAAAPRVPRAHQGPVRRPDNASEQRKASSSYAAEFLRQFVGDTPWVHVDIAGVAWGGTREYVGSGASGWGVRMLVELARGAVR